MYCNRSCVFACNGWAGGVRTLLQPARAQCLRLSERFFSLSISTGMEKYWHHITTSLKSVVALPHTLQTISGQLYRFKAQLIQFKVMYRRLIIVNVHDGCYFFVCLHRLIYNMCLKCPPLANMHALSSVHQWSMGMSTICCSMLCQNIYIYNWKVSNQGVDRGGWGLPPENVGGVRVCFDSPLKCHILSFKTVVV